MRGILGVSMFLGRHTMSGGASTPPARSRSSSPRPRRRARLCSLGSLLRGSRGGALSFSLLVGCVVLVCLVLIVVDAIVLARFIELFRRVVFLITFVVLIARIVLVVLLPPPLLRAGLLRRAAATPLGRRLFLLGLAVLFV
jgi:hypothetical protein